MDIEGSSTDESTPSKPSRKTSVRDRFFPLPSELDPEGFAAGADPPEAGLGAEVALVEAVAVAEADVGSPEAWPETNEVFLLS